MEHVAHKSLLTGGALSLALLFSGCAATIDREKAADEIGQFNRQHEADCRLVEITEEGDVTSEFSDACAQHEREMALLKYALEGGKWPEVSAIYLRQALQSAEDGTFDQTLREDGVLGENETVLGKLDEKGLITFKCNISTRNSAYDVEIGCTPKPNR